MLLPLLTELYEDHVADLSRRYGNVITEIGFDAVVLHSGSLQKRTDFDDQYWPLRPMPHFQHWLPLAQPDCALILEPGKKPRLAWLRVKSFWEKPALPETLHFVPSFDVHEVDATDAVKALLPKAGRVAFIGEAHAHATSWGVGAEARNPPGLLARLDELRVTKTPYEVHCLAEANRRAAAGHQAIRQAFVAGDHSELDLHLSFLSATQQDDAETPYKNIVALGPHAATLHHIAYGKIKSGASPESLLLDAGSSYQGYCSDITRTWVKGAGAEASEFQGLVEEVEAMQKRLCAAIRVGMPYENLHEESHRQVGTLLKNVGVSRLSSEEAVASGVTRAFFPHGLGHSLGLQCHDVGCAVVKPKENHPYLRNTSTIAVGQVFTIEPGIYFIEPLLIGLRASPNAGSIDWKKVDALAKLGGVRIEDDLVITGDSRVARNLTREHLP